MGKNGEMKKLEKIRRIKHSKKLNKMKNIKNWNKEFEKKLKQDKRLEKFIIKNWKRNIKK